MTLDENARATAMPSTDLPLSNFPFLIPDWPAPARVRAACSTRAGGVSLSTPLRDYGSLNLGDHVGDAPECVARNRQRLAAALQAQPVFMQQIHGTHCVELDTSSPKATSISADACSTAATGIACTIMVADCLPILFCNAQGTQVAACHAGWRGLAAGVIETSLNSFLNTKTSIQAEKPAWTAIKNDANPIMAWLGPCIGFEAFEVGSEVREAFLLRYPRATAHFKPSRAAGKWLCDLQGIARQILHAAGVATYGNDGSTPWCTYSQPARWFSHRRATQSGCGQAGRMAACVWLENPV